MNHTLAASVIVAVTTGSVNAQMPELLDVDEEARIALSAAPEHLKAEAGVWVLTSDGFVEHRSSSNGFNCVINRDHPLNIKPTCYDAEGSATILPKVIFMGNEMVRGAPIERIRAQVAERFESGEFVSPRRPGVAYMLTNEIRNCNPSTGRCGTFPPHIMFYAPNLTNADIGWSREGAALNPWLPSIAYQGPHGFMIVVPPR